MHRSKKKRNIIIFSLIGILMCMTIVYAAFQTKLEIKGTSKVTSNWDIEITNVTNGTPVGEAENAVAPTWTMTTASMEANLYNKGDAMEYDVTIENKGSIDAKLNDILTNVEKENNEAVLITFSGYTKGEILKAGSTKLIHVKIEYNPNYEGEETSSEVEINFDYVQNNNEINNPDNQYLITYDYASNGGSSVNIKEEYYSAGLNVNLNNIAYKEGYTFVGWNTDKNAKVGLTNYQINENVTLYAIYSKALNITYQQGENIQSISKTNDTCTIYNNETSCEITLPSITSNTGYNPDGWYNGESKVGGSAEKYKLNNNLTLTAKAIDNIKPDKPVIRNDWEDKWTNTSVTVFVTSADEGSGIDHFEYYYNNQWMRGNWDQNDTVFLPFTQQINDEVRFRVVDKAGNISEETSTTIKIDKTPPSCNSSGESSKWSALTQTITGTCLDDESGCSNSQISKTYSIAENITGNYDGSYSPGEVTDNAGNITVCPNVQVRVTGTTLKDYTEGAVFMYDGKTGLSSTTWQDQSGNNRNGTLVGATKSGNSVYFDGKDDYVRIAELNYSAVTLETSFKAININNNSPKNLISNVQSGGYRLYVSSGLYIAASAYKSGSYSTAYLSSPILTDKIYYAAGRVNSLFSNTILNDSNFKTVEKAADITFPLSNTYIVLGINPKGNGIDSYNNSENFNGYIYTARMYSKVLTDDELQKHYVIDKWRYNF